MKNFLKLLSVILLTGIIFSACQKEYDIIDGTATGTLKEDASGDCMPVTINGIYTANVTVGAGNFADIQVNIDNIGTYDISTDTVNGYFFHGAGSVALTGLNTIRLQASGKPIISGTDIFRVKFSGTACELNVSVVTGTTLPQAVLIPNCSLITTSGLYQAGTAMTSANTITVPVLVNTAGTYTATTVSQNGVSFSGSGTVTTSTSFITLTASSTTPIAQGSFTYQITLNGLSSCSVPITYSSATTGGTGSLICSINGGPSRTFNLNAFADTSVAGTSYALNVSGFASLTAPQEVLSLNVIKDPGYFASGTSYTVNELASGIIVGVGYQDGTGAMYSAASSGPPQTPAFTITISTLTPTHITGTFNGPVDDGAGSILTLSGTFDFPLN